MPRLAYLRRHRARVASGVTLALLVGAVVTYAVTADGYKAHEADLNDGGVWVVNGDKGWSGRINKPINQLDGVVAGEDAKLRMDILQDGAAVVAVNLDSGRGQAIEPARLTNVDGAAASVPAQGDIAMGGGSLATVDTGNGKVWAVRYDARVGKPAMGMVDRNSDPVEEVGNDAVLTVSGSGTVVAVSAEESTVTRLPAAGSGFAPTEEEPLGADAGEPTSVTTVGETVVTLDAARGIVQVVGGPTAKVPDGSVLQQAGPPSDNVLVGTPDALLAVDLESGEATEVAAQSSGSPAAPVRLGACAFGAWSGGSGTVAVQCGSDPATVDELTGKASDLVFRVNRDEIVLNDSLSGSVWDVQQDKPVKIDTWESFTSRKKEKDDDKKSEDRNNADRRPPKARPDTYGVRAGRTTVIHPLDNDSAPEGRLLSIVDVDTPTNDARVEISPDGQTLVVQVPQEARSTTFEYHINDGRSGLSAHAPVTVTVRDDKANEAPALREGYTKPAFHVANGGSISVPVLADWRDDRDGDALLLESVSLAGGDQPGVTARTTSDGRIRVVSAPLADAAARTVRVDYAVSDGRAEPVRKTLDFEVQASKDETAHPPTAAPDVVRGEVGKPVKVRPLLNDLPGSDPTTKYAELRIAGAIPSQPGVEVKTDLDSGVITVRAQEAGTYFLDYEAAYGAAPLDQGMVRVDVHPRPRRGGDPVAMPDTLTLFGQAPGVVDVLANDLDPAGALLAVQRADAARQDDLDVAVIDGRWLRVSARRPDLVPATGVVTYTVSNGVRVAQGELVVTQRPEPDDNTPVTAPDHAVVRAGSSVAVPVLDNDVSPSGDRLTLLTDVSEGAPGQLRVVTPSDFRGDPGKAFVSGRVLRFVAPTDVDQRETFEIAYVAQNLAGITAEGRARITVVPDDGDNSPPTPPTLEGRVVSGDTVKVRLPGVGVDPDGDPVTVTGITAAPRLGRITAFGGNYVEYRAYPRTNGTDEFTYAVMDGKGAVATGTARIAVVALGEPQPPLAVDDRLTVKPGRTATFDPLANDFVAPGDQVRVELVGAPDGVELDPDTTMVRVKAPDDAAAASTQVVYRITNGLAESRATLTLDVNPEFNNPPIVYDSFGRAGDSGAVELDVLEGAYDPDGSLDDLEVVEVLGDATGTSISGSSITINREAHPQVVPFRIEDGDGGSATASVYVPSTGEGLPFVKPDALITVDVGGSVTGDVADYVESPDSSQLRIVDGQAAVSGSPSAISVAREGDTSFTVRAGGGYRGPGAALVEVTTATDEAGNEDETTAEDGATALVSIPVQVGDDKPELSCPDNTIELTAGQEVEVDLATLCQVWTVDPRDAAGLAYTAEWSAELEGVTLGGPTGSTLDLSVDPDASRGGEGIIDVRAGDSNTASLRFRLSAAPSPRLLPIKVEQMSAGESRTIDLAPYLQPGVANPDPTVVSIRSIGTSRVRASASGSSVTFQVPDGARGRAAFLVRMSDVSDSDPGAARVAEGRLEFSVGGLPGQPSAPQIHRPEESSRAEMDWVRPADDGGSPITHYILEVMGTNISRKCPTTTCSIGGLKPNKEYRFRVRAVNKIGAGEWSAPSTGPVTAGRPGRVQDIEMLKQDDGSITIGWRKPAIGSEELKEHEIRWGDQKATVDGSVRQFTATGLNNNRSHVFRIRVRNAADDVSEWQESDAFWPLGTPAAPTGLRATDNESGAVQTSVRLDWTSTLPEGKGPTRYTVSYNAGGTTANVPGCVNLRVLRCMHAGVAYDGTTYSYTVRAINDGRKRSPASAAATFQAVGRPAGWGAWEATPVPGGNQQFTVKATVPAPRGGSAMYSVLVNGVAQGAPKRVREGQGINEVYSTPNNTAAHLVQLKLCNESGTAAGCTTSDVRSVHTHGPLTAQHLTVTPDEAVGTALSWHIVADPNGPSATVTYWYDGNQAAAQTRTITAAGSISVSTTAPDYEESVTLHVRLSDPATGRTGVEESATATAGKRPTASITISKGSTCNDEEGSSQVCARSSGEPECTEAGCAKIRIQATNLQFWGGNLRCTLTEHPHGWFVNANDYETVSINAPGRNLGWYSPGGQVTVTCTNDQLGQPLVASTTW